MVHVTLVHTTSSFCNTFFFKIKVTYKPLKCDGILCLGDIHKIICIRGRFHLVTIRARTPLLAGAALPAHMCRGPVEVSLVERYTVEMPEDSKMQYNSYTEIENALRRKNMTQFLGSAVKFLLSTTGTSLEE